jgi:predicted RNA-binding Zn-ribbon protein involved in translation (DUF1610 family)
MARLRNIQRFPFVLPLRNICLNQCASLIDSVRWAVFDFFAKSHDGEKPFMMALRWLLSQEYNPDVADRSWVLASCPSCHTIGITVPRSTPDQFPCPHCRQIIYLTDVFRSR